MPRSRRQRTFDALKKLFLRESLDQPLIVIVEDLHWIDTETQGFLDTLSESVASAHVLLLVNYRPEYKHDWGQKTYYTQLRLAPLGKAEAEEFLTALLGDTGGTTGRSSLHELKRLILERTDSTPFFMEEVVQTLVEEGELTGERGNYQLETAPTELHISPTVQGVLAARIDRLAGEEKTLLQQLAVIGRQFPISLVKQVVTQPEDELYRILASLQAKEFLYEQPAFPESDYIFKHALTQDVAYGTVLQEQRRALHERTGQAMETLYTEQLDDHYSELAHHYSQSGNTEKAIEYLYRTGQQAIQRSADGEAVTDFTTALELLQALPDGPERMEQELRIQVALGPAVLATAGFGSSELDRVYTRALELCHQLEDSAQLFSALRGVWFGHTCKGELGTAREIGEHLTRLADEVHSPALQIEAYYSLGLSLFWSGEILEGRTYLERAMGLYDPHQPAASRIRYGQDPGVVSNGQATYALWTLGYPTQAMQASRSALTMAQEASHPLSSAFAFIITAGLHLQCRDYPPVQEYIDAASALSVEYGFGWYTAMVNIFSGGLLTAQGQPVEGIPLIQQGLDFYRPLGGVLWWPYYMALLAEAYGKAGQRNEGLKIVAEALERVNKTGEHWHEAELYRLKGELTLQDSQDAKESESYFQKALAVAQQQEAKSWELRAAMSLAQLWREQGKIAEAYDVLAPVYNWFTEGFDTADLKDAKALLEELSLVRFSSSISLTKIFPGAVFGFGFDQKGEEEAAADG